MKVNINKKEAPRKFKEGDLLIDKHGSIVLMLDNYGDCVVLLNVDNPGEVYCMEVEDWDMDEFTLFNGVLELSN